MMWHVIKLDLMGIRRNNLLPITLSIFLTLPILMPVHACGQFCNRTFNSEYVAKILLKSITSIITTSFHWIDENSET